MNRSWWIRFLVLAAAVVTAGIYVYPSLKGIDPSTSNFPFKQKINMGLDLQGGVYMVLGIDLKKVYQEQLSKRFEMVEKKALDAGYTNVTGTLRTEDTAIDDPRWVLDLGKVAKTGFRDWIKTEFSDLRLAQEDSATKVEYGLSREFRTDLRERTLAQSIEVIRNRIDEFGVSEPVITSQGTDRIVVELPGIKDVERAKDLIGRTARLEFRLVNDEAMDMKALTALIMEIEEKDQIKYEEGKGTFSDYVQKIQAKAVGRIPDDSEILFEKVKGVLGESTNQRLPYLVFKKTSVTGDDLQDAMVGVNPETHRPEVSLTFNPRGATTFDDVTGQNVGKRLAIVLDRVVHSAPVLQTRISNGRAVITLGQGNGERLLQEAKDLSTVLRAGALPAQLEFLEQRSVGPSLGEDSIKKGTFAALVGSLLVFVFMLFYYRISGVIAVVSLLLNVLFVLASLVGLEATLTLPGIAGIALTVGIAVDSNVVIYERIREELRAGKNPWGAVDSGFQKAFRTILDANVTNAAAAIVLLLYGTGPVRGFAVTLLIGIATTLFTAVFVCRIFFEAYLTKMEKTKEPLLSI